MIGAVHISQALAPIARIAGLDPVVIDPRTAFASPERFPDVRAYRPMAGCASWTLRRSTRSRRWRCSPMIPRSTTAPLSARSRLIVFISARSARRKTHAKRLERMRGEGFDDVALARIHAPIGLDIGAVSPAEIAVSICWRDHRGSAQEAVALGARSSSRSPRPPSGRDFNREVWRIPAEEAEGAIAAHAIRSEGFALRRGPSLPQTSLNCPRLGGGQPSSQRGSSLETSAIPSPPERLASPRRRGDNLRREPPFTGRVNLFAGADGLLKVDAAAIDAINQPRRGRSRSRRSPPSASSPKATWRRQ